MDFYTLEHLAQARRDRLYSQAAQRRLVQRCNQRATSNLPGILVRSIRQFRLKKQGVPHANQTATYRPPCPDSAGY